MGFIGGFKTKQEAYNDFIENQKPLQMKEVQDGYWILSKLTDGTNYILFLCIEKDTYGYMYKPIGEEFHPCYYDCPKNFLKDAPIVRCQDWRDCVILYHNKDYDGIRKIMDKVDSDIRKSIENNGLEINDEVFFTHQPKDYPTQTIVSFGYNSEERVAFFSNGNWAYLYDIFHIINKESYFSQIKE
jgi:hypothetical protein